MSRTLPFTIALLKYLNGAILASFRDSRAISVGIDGSPDAMLWDNANNLYVGLQNDNRWAMFKFSPIQTTFTSSIPAAFFL